jgi:probable HAF family extracellular repeat protein
MHRLALNTAVLGATLLAACAEPSAESAASSVGTPGAAVGTNAVSYSVSDISTGPNDNSYAWDVNDKRVVVGWSNTSTGTHGWVASSPSAPAWLPEPRGARGSEGFAITNSGMIAGTLIFVGGRTTPAFWPSRTSLPRLIPLPAGALFLGDGYGVNSLGQVAGTYFDSSGNRQAFFWDQATNVTTTLGTFGGASAQAHDINDQGKVVGCADDWQTGQPQAFVWTPSTGLVRLDPASPIGCAYGINRRGDAAGWMERGGIDSAAVFPLCCTPRHFLPRRAIGASLSDLNDSLTAVGTLTLTTGMIAFAADQNLATTNLPLVAASSESHATGINACGVIVGWEVDTKVRALLWRPMGC